MSEAIAVAIITGVLTLAGSVITILATSSKTQQEIKTHQAVTDTKIEELTREVRAHNNFAQRLPVLEAQVKDTVERVKTLEKKA